MSDEIKNRILAICFGVMKPLAFLLVKNGLGYHALEETAKRAFVEAIRDNFGVQKRKTNISRVCAMSGMSRREVNRIIDGVDTEEKAPATDWQRRKPAMVLATWYGSPSYLDEFAQPRAIPFEGRGPTFTRLVKEVGVGDLTAMTMLKELIRVGCVVEEDEKYRAVSATYIPTTDNPELITVAGDALRQMAWTVVQNLVTKDQGDRFYQRRVIFDDLPKQDRGGFKRMAGVEAQGLLERFNEWGTAREYKTRKERGRELKRKERNVPTIGVGIYYFDSTYEEQKKS